MIVKQVKVLKDCMVNEAKYVCGSANMCKSIKGDAQQEDEVKATIDRKKKACLDYVACLERKNDMKGYKKICKNA